MHILLITVFLHAHGVFILCFAAEVFKTTVLLVDLCHAHNKNSD